MTILKLLFGQNPSPEPSIDAQKATDVSKAIETVALIGRTYDLPVFPEADSKRKYKHDLGLMRAFGDLKHVRLELLAADNTVLAEVRIEFDAGSGVRRPDAGHGVEVPVLDQRLVAGHRLIVQRHGNDSPYKQWLQIPWASAENLPVRPGSDYDSDHHRRITGGRQAGKFHVAAEARHRLVVTQAGSKGFAFAKAPDLGADGVFLHAVHAPTGLTFRIGQKLTAVIAQTPRGLQGRAILSAEGRA